MAPTLFTNASAVLKSGNAKSFSMWCPVVTVQRSTWAARRSISPPANGGTPPRQGTQVFSASDMSTPYSDSLFEPACGRSSLKQSVESWNREEHEDHKAAVSTAPI